MAKRTKALWMALILTVLVAVTEYVILSFNAPSPDSPSIPQSTTRDYFIFAAAVALSLIPSIYLSYGGFHPGWGILPPLLLNSLLWLILISRYARFGMSTYFISHSILLLAASITILTGLFGFLIASLSRRIFNEIAELEQETCPEEKKISENTLMESDIIVETDLGTESQQERRDASASGEMAAVAAEPPPGNQEP